MNAEKINEAITLLNEYQMLNEIYRISSQIMPEIRELTRKYDEAKSDVVRTCIAEEIEKKINCIFVANKRINLSVKCDIYLYGIGQAVKNIESKIVCLISNIEEL